MQCLSLSLVLQMRRGGRGGIDKASHAVDHSAPRMRRPLRVSASAWCCRCDEEAVEDDVRKRSASEDAMGAKTLCIPLEQPNLPPGTPCFASGRPAKNWALWGRSY